MQAELIKNGEYAVMSSRTSEKYLDYKLEVRNKGGHGLPVEEYHLQACELSSAIENLVPDQAHETTRVYFGETLSETGQNKADMLAVASASRHSNHRAVASPL
jgi:hypothetical protein